jgi:toxin YhaV
MSFGPCAERNGWKLFAHPAFGDKVQHLIETVDQLRQRQPWQYAHHPKAKLLKRILDLILIEIPKDPNSPTKVH